MGQLLESQNDFLSLILKTGKQQRKALLDTLTHEQIDLLGEIFFNLINNFPISEQERKTLNRKKFIKILTDFKKKHSSRNSTIKKNKKYIADLLMKYKDNLLTLIR